MVSVFGKSNKSFTNRMNDFSTMVILIYETLISNNMSEVGDRKIHGAEIVLKNWSELRCKFLLLLNQHLLSFAMRTHNYEITVEYIFQYSFSFIFFGSFFHSHEFTKL